jgi:hypothetical protein
MIVLLAFAGLAYWILMERRVPELHNRIIGIKELAEPEIGDKLKIESTKQIFELIKKIEYREDITDTTRRPSETIKLGWGDCEDLSLLAYSLFEYLELSNPNIAILYNEDDIEAHAIAYFWCDYCCEYYIVSNNTYFKAPSIEQAAEMLGYSKVVFSDGYISDVANYEEITCPT